MIRGLSAMAVFAQNLLLKTNKVYSVKTLFFRVTTAAVQ